MRKIISIILLVLAFHWATSTSFSRDNKDDVYTWFGIEGMTSTEPNFILGLNLNHRQDYQVITIKYVKDFDRETGFVNVLNFCPDYEFRSTEIAAMYGMFLDLGLLSFDFSMGPGFLLVKKRGEIRYSSGFFSICGGSYYDYYRLNTMGISYQARVMLLIHKNVSISGHFSGNLNQHYSIFRPTVSLNLGFFK